MRSLHCPALGKPRACPNDRDEALCSCGSAGLMEPLSLGSPLPPLSPRSPSRPAQRVEVAAKEVRIMGSKTEFLQTLAAASSVEAAKIGVPSSVLKWRTRQDSNL